MLISIPRTLLAEILPHGATFTGDEDLCRFVAEQYRLGDYIPRVWIEDDGLFIEIDDEKVADSGSTLQRIIRFAESRRYAEAKALISETLAQGTSDSEIFRIHGQILFDEGSFDEALNQFIDASKLNPDNVHVDTNLGNLPTLQCTENNTIIGISR